MFLLDSPDFSKTDVWQKNKNNDFSQITKYYIVKVNRSGGKYVKKITSKRGEISTNSGGCSHRSL